MSRGSLLVVPASEPGRGSGHLVRGMALVRELRDLDRESWLYLPAAARENTLITTAGFNRELIMPETGVHGKHWECIILDRFQTPPEELARWTRLAPVIGIDEGGLRRNHFDFLIDILPNGERTKPNIAGTFLLPLPEKPHPRETTPGAPLRILVSFGQEDAAGLGLAAAQSLAAHAASAEITLLRGALEKEEQETHTPPFLIQTAIPHLVQHLTNYDLLITHYGLTAFEALYAGIPVLLASPGAYHEKLAKAAGFYSLGIGKGSTTKLSGLLFTNGVINEAFLGKLKKQRADLAARYNLDHTPPHSLAQLINGFTPNVSRNCPVCGMELRGHACARFSERTYKRCKQCGTIHMNRLNPPPIEYGREYFFELYQKQYGKTYIEDFPHLIAMGKRRLAVIKPLLPHNSAPRLLDIGCAYGPFLAAAQAMGFSPYGIDPAEDAVRYVTHTLQIPAVQGFFPSVEALPLPAHSCDVITLWYVIEHFRDCIPVLAEIRTLLKPGGILAFATPSFSGISGRSSLRRFLERSPADHWTIWSPRTCKKALKAAGFTVKKTVISGHHPERFPLLGKYAQSRKSPLYLLLRALSAICSLGDTFEVYAVKNTD